MRGILKSLAGLYYIERLKHVGIISVYPWEEFEMIAKGKSAIAKCAVAALAVLCNKIEKIEPLEKSQDYFFTALQLCDDLTGLEARLQDSSLFLSFNECYI